jgi:hypothetical protein
MWTDVGSSVTKLGTDLTNVLANVSSPVLETITLCISVDVESSPRLSPSPILPSVSLFSKSWAPLSELMEGQRFARLKTLQIRVGYQILEGSKHNHAAVFQNIFPRLHAQGRLQTRLEF